MISVQYIWGISHWQLTLVIVKYVIKIMLAASKKVITRRWLSKERFIWMHWLLNLTTSDCGCVGMYMRVGVHMGRLVVGTQTGLAWTLEKKEMARTGILTSLNWHCLYHWKDHTNVILWPICYLYWTNLWVCVFLRCVCAFSVVVYYMLNIQ